MSLRILVTAGPTREYIDDVRYLSNASTGAMGVAVCEACRRAGWSVALVHGPLEVPVPAVDEAVPVTSASDMFLAVEARFELCDVFIAAAAVADWTPARRSTGKLKKGANSFQLDLSPTRDILAWCGERRRPEQTIVGFGLEADTRIETGWSKLEGKRCDLLVHNSPANFGAGGGMVRILAKGRRVLLEGTHSKREVARHLVEAILASRGA